MFQVTIRLKAEFSVLDGESAKCCKNVNDLIKDGCPVSMITISSSNWQQKGYTESKLVQNYRLRHIPSHYPSHVALMFKKKIWFDLFT